MEFIRYAVEFYGVDGWWAGWRWAHSRMMHGIPARMVLDGLGFTYEMILQVEKLLGLDWERSQ